MDEGRGQHAAWGPEQPCRGCGMEWGAHSWGRGANGKGQQPHTWTCVVDGCLLTKAVHLAGMFRFSMLEESLLH